jgi:HEAT repeat protein
MFEKLDAIDWAALSHAYGSAEDVPELLRALVSDDEETRHGALDALYGNIWHQGTIYEATGYAVPFLFEIAADERLPDRREVLELLHAIAEGTSYLDVHQHLSFVGERLKEQPTFEADKARELQFVERAVDRIVERVPALLKLVAGDRDPQVASQAAKVIAACRDRARSALPELMRIARGAADPDLRASVLFTVACLDIGAARHALLEGLDAPHPMTALAAALALGLLAKPPLEPRAIEVLLEHLGDLERVDYERFPFGDDQAADIARALGNADPAIRARAAQALLGHAKNQKVGIFSAAEPLLLLAFPERRERPDLESLSPLQREVLSLIAKNTWTKLRGSWSTFANFSQLLREYGLEELGERVAGYR